MFDDFTDSDADELEVSRHRSSGSRRWNTRRRRPPPPPPLYHSNSYSEYYYSPSPSPPRYHHHYRNTSNSLSHHHWDTTISSDLPYSDNRTSTNSSSHKHQRLTDHHHCDPNYYNFDHRLYHSQQIHPTNHQSLSCKSKIRPKFHSDNQQPRTKSTRCSPQTNSQNHRHSFPSPSTYNLHRSNSTTLNNQNHQYQFQKNREIKVHKHHYGSQTKETTKAKIYSDRDYQQHSSLFKDFPLGDHRDSALAYPVTGLGHQLGQQRYHRSGCDGLESEEERVQRRRNHWVVAFSEDDVEEFVDGVQSELDSVVGGLEARSMMEARVEELSGWPRSSPSEIGSRQFSEFPKAHPEKLLVVDLDPGDGGNRLPPECEDQREAADSLPLFGPPSPSGSFSPSPSPKQPSKQIKTKPSFTLVDAIKFVADWFDKEECLDNSYVGLEVEDANCGVIVRNGSMDSFIEEHFGTVETLVDSEYDLEFRHDENIDCKKGVSWEVIASVLGDETVDSKSCSDAVKRLIQVTENNICHLEHENGIGLAAIGLVDLLTRREKNRQWLIAWLCTLLRLSIALIPLWLWDERRRDFSVGVFHAHKTKRFMMRLGSAFGLRC